MPIKLSDRLTNINPDGSVIDFLNEDPIRGIIRTGLTFQENNYITQLGGATSAVPKSKGDLPFLLGGDVSIPPEKRFLKGGLIFARNSLYEYTPHSGNDMGFERIYYRPGPSSNNGYFDAFNALSEPIIVTHDFLPGGYYYEIALSGGSFSISDGTSSFDQDFFYGEESDFGFELGVESSSSEQTDFIQAIAAALSGTNITFTSPEYVHGSNLSYPNAIPDSAFQFYEMLLQADAYPGIGSLQAEIAANPQEFFFHLYDAKRDATHKLSLAKLAAMLNGLLNVVPGTGGSPQGGQINLTMPLLTTTQLSNLYEYDSGIHPADLNGDGSISTADLLEFLTAFGQDPGVGTATVTQGFDSVMTYHSGGVSDTSPFFELGSAYYAQQNQGATALLPATSLGIADFDGVQFVPEVTGTTLGNLITQNPGTVIEGFGNIVSVDFSWAEFAWRLKSYAENNFEAHISEGYYDDSFFDPNYASFVDSQVMQPIGTYAVTAATFDGAMPFLNNSGVVRYESFSFAEGQSLAVSAALMTTIPQVSFTDNAEGLSESQTTFIPPPWQGLHGNPYPDFLTLNDPQMLDSGAAAGVISDTQAFKYTVRGYVTADPGSAASVFIILRANVAVLSEGQLPLGVNTPLGGNFVLFLGGVDMTTDVTLDEENNCVYKNFNFVVDVRDINNPDMTIPENYAVRRIPCGNTGNVGGHYYTQSLGAFSMFDNIKSVVFTGVAIRQLNTAG